MNEFRNMCTSNYDSVSSTIAGVNSYLEYLERMKLRALDFLSPEGDEDTFTLIATRNNKNIIHFLSRDDYEWAQEHYDDPTAKRAIRLNDAGDTNELSASDIIDGFDDTIENMSLQIEYLNLSLDDESEVTKTSFIDRITQLYPNIVKEKINQFADYIESSDAITSIKNFFSSFDGWVVSKITDASVDEIIEIANADEYVTNLPIVVGGLIEFFKQVGSFFAGVFVAVGNIAHFFIKLYEAFVNLLTWVIMKVNRQLMSNYQFTKKANGILDIPLVQCRVCQLGDDLEPIDGPANYMGYNTAIARAVNCEKYTYLFGPGTQETALYNAHWKKLLSGAFKKTWKNQVIRNVTEVIIPCEQGFGWNSNYVPISFSLRLGPGSDGYGYLQLIPIIQVSIIKEMTDHQIAASINYSFDKIAHKFRTYFNVMGFNYNDVPGTGTYLWTNNSYWLLDPGTINTSDTTPYDLVGNAPFFTPSHLAEPSDRGAQFRALCFGFLLPYMILNSNLVENVKTLIDSEHVTIDRVNYLLGMGTEVTNPNVTQSISYYKADSTDDFEVLIPLYKPYSVYKKLPVSAHYQTVIERKTEIANTIWAVLIAAAATYLIVKYVGLRKQRKFTQKMLDSSVDARLWENTLHPGSYNVADIYKDWKKANRFRFTSGLLGIGTASAAAGGIGSFIGATMSLAGKGVETMVDTTTNLGENITKVGKTIDPSFSPIED